MKNADYSGFLYTAEQVRLAEAEIINRGSITGYDLMERAAGAAYRYISGLEIPVQSILIVCGPGNNGGDGYVLARLLTRAWRGVTLVSVSEPDDLVGDAARARDDWIQSGGSIQRFSGSIPDADLILDCMLGTGVSRPLRGDYLTVVNMINMSSAMVIAIDIPTGLDSDRGVPLPVAIEAQATITFVGFKQGQYLADGPDFCGELVFNDLDIGGEALGSTQGLKLIAPGQIESKYPTRKKNSYKGSYGHVVVVGGSPGTQGAVRLAAEAALRAGAGMVSVITHPDHQNTVCASTSEIMCHGANTPDNVMALIHDASVLVVGPGLGTDRWASQWLPACAETKKPLVVDAGALRYLASHSDVNVVSNWVLTPHPGEAADLLGLDSAAVQSNRVAAIQKLQAEFGGVFILKGSGTLVTDGNSISLCRHGNPGMATAGMGDVLSGIIAAVMVVLPEHHLSAAELGVVCHALAGDRAAGNKPVGLIARDLYPHIRNQCNPAR